MSQYSQKTESQTVAALEALGATIGKDDQGNVVMVNLDRCQVTDEDLRLVEQLPKVELLSFRFMQITDAGLVHLKGLTNLKECYFTIAQPGLETLKQTFPKCYFDEG